MTLPRHAKYRDSGQPWLGLVPSHWGVRRLKTLFEIRKRIVGEEGHQVLSITQRGIKVKDIESNDGQLSMDYSKYQIVHPGDFAMNHMDLLTGYVDIASFAGVTSPDYRVFAVRDDVRCDPRYFLYLLQNGYRQKIFYAFGQGASEFGRWRLPTDQFNDFRFPFPPADEQLAIVSFLDRETAKIDALIAEQEKLIALLAEKRQATISHAVTRGLKPDAPKKDSGVPWLGEVPAHWSVQALRRAIAAIEQGWSPECHAREAEPNEWGVLKAGCLNGGVFRATENKALPPELSPDPKYEVLMGDVLMSRASGSPELVGSTALVIGTRPRLMLSDKIFRIRLQATVLPRYFVAALGSRALRAQIENALSGGNGMANNLPQSSLMSFAMTVPPIDEQMEIANFIDEELGRLDRLRSESELGIGLLKERRSVLIAAAVTGQIDVRGAVSQPALLEELAA